MSFSATMHNLLRNPVNHGLRAALLTVPLLLAACGDDGDTEASSDVTATSEDGGSSDDAPTDEGGSGDTEGSDGGAAPVASAELCDIVSADDVAAAAGIEVASTTPSSGTGSYQEIEYSTIGCSYETADGGDVSINALTDEMGTQLEPEILLDLTAASAASSFDDFPHEEVPGLGNGALFLASLGPSDSLIIDASPAPVLEIRNHRELPLDREALKAVGEVAVEAYS